MEKDSRLDERLNQLETSAAATGSDLRSLFNAVEGLAEEVRSLVNRRPNIGLMTMAIIASLGLIATLSTLAMSPIYRSLGIHARAIEDNDKTLEDRAWIIGAQMAKTDDISKSYDDMLTRIYRLENQHFHESHQ